jgi:hypothetical protein
VRRVEYHHSQISIWSQEQSSRAGKREKRRKRQKIHPADMMLVKQCRKSRISTPLHTHSSIHYITDYFILFFPFPSLAFVFSFACLCFFQTTNHAIPAQSIGHLEPIQVPYPALVLLPQNQEFHRPFTNIKNSDYPSKRMTCYI